MYAPSGGEGYLNGHNIRTDMSKARQSLGLCPQHNMLIPDLTVMEHLIFFGMVLFPLNELVKSVLG
jgi:ATP-binding cassette subfamily A (ABC1) protein 3